MSKIILDLCGGTGSWSKPYKDAGYDVRLITLPFYDVRTYNPPENVYGILAAPPCTHFSNSGAQYWQIKDEDGRTFEDITILTTCLMIIAKARPSFFAIENPVGRMSRLLGKPGFKFDPYEFGDPYTKRTYLWGRFNVPQKSPVTPEYVIAKNGDRYSKIHWYTGGTSAKTKELRSATPQGFAKAFMEANQ